MSCYAGLTTSKGSTAIAAVELVGQGCESIISKMFKEYNSKPRWLERNCFEHAKILFNEEIIDDVVISRDLYDNYCINCHGNPLIIKRVLQIVEDLGGKIVDSREITKIKAIKVFDKDTISMEAAIAHPDSKTLEGVGIILAQCERGLKKWASESLKSIEKLSSVRIRHQALLILENSQIANLLINGAKVVLTGPPNSGKSTLLNALTGKSKAIVSEVEGTTRDWVDARCKFKKYIFDFIDTAGIKPELAAGGKIDSVSQNIAMDMLKGADMILLVLDGSESTEIWFEHEALWQTIIRNNTPVMTVLNKSDLGKNEAGGLWISAIKNKGIDKVLDRIIENLRLDEFEPKLPVCFTPRQLEIVRFLTQEKDKSLTELLFKKLLHDKI